MFLAGCEAWTASCVLVYALAGGLPWTYVDCVAKWGILVGAMTLRWLPWLFPFPTLVWFWTPCIVVCIALTCVGGVCTYLLNGGCTTWICICVDSLACAWATTRGVRISDWPFVLFAPCAFRMFVACWGLSPLSLSFGAWLAAWLYFWRTGAMLLCVFFVK